MNKRNLWIIISVVMTITMFIFSSVIMAQENESVLVNGNETPLVNTSVFSNPVPSVGQTMVNPGTDISINIDTGSSRFNATFTLYDSSLSNPVVTKELTNVQSGVHSFDVSDYTNKKGNTFLWKIVVKTSTDRYENIYRFSTGLFLETKWKVAIGNSSGAQIHPLMGDIDGDGDQEIVMAVGDYIVSVDAKTGKTEWRASGSAKTAIELVDLDNNGNPEVLYGTSSKRLRALKGDGSVFWTSEILNGSIQAEYPIVAGDVNADGYPEIFYASGDVTPSPYSGNDSEYTGAMTKLDHTGKVLDTVWIHHPCWGGLTLADYDYDGNFEVYMGDRRAGYQGFPAKGLQAFDANTLDMLWSKPELQHSSPMAIMDDVVGNDDLEVIAEPITIRGPIVVNPANGQNMMDYSSLRLPTHATGTTYDIDGDGNLEIFFGTAYPTSAEKNIVVFDLVDNTTDFTQYFNVPATWPPTAAEVTGDGKLDIIATMGVQDNTSDFPLIIFNSEYSMVEEQIIPGAGQLMPAVVGDADNDGKNEIIVAGINGVLALLETDADTPSPAPRTWVQRYSEYRRGAAEYVELPGPKAPVLTNESPANNSTNVSIKSELSVRVFDYQKDSMKIVFSINDGTTWKTMKEYENQDNGIYSADGTDFVVKRNTTYQWKVEVEDEKGNKNQATFSFKTGGSSSDNPNATNTTNTTGNTTNTTGNTTGNTTNTTGNTTGNTTNTTGNTTNNTTENVSGVIKLVIDHHKVQGDLTDFPLLIDIISINLKDEVSENAGNIFFTLEDKQTKLPHEVESYNSSNGHLVAWVKVPSLSSSVDTVLYLHYGKTQPATDTSEQVWDSNYLAVHHFEESAGAITDSTGANKDGTSQNGVQLDAAGKIAGGDKYDGVDDAVTLPQIYNAQKQFTIEGWVNSGSKRGYLASQRDLALHGVFIQYYYPERNFQLYVNNYILKINSTPNEWHHIVATYDGTNSRLYVDGGEPYVLKTTAPIWPAGSMYIGNRESGGRALNGSIDEIRLSDTARSEAYIRTSFLNQRSPRTFVLVNGQLPVPQETTNVSENNEQDFSGTTPEETTNSTPKPEEYCTDGKDNDGDLEIDCADSTCADFIGCQNLCGNGIVNNDEFRNEECDDGNLNNNDGCSAVCYVEENYECTGEPSTCSTTAESCGGADINGDSKVNLLDLIIFTGNFDRDDCSVENEFCNGADLNKDEKVSGGDLVLFVPKFGIENCNN